MIRYSYEGPVMIFDVCVKDRWLATTYAKTEKKAKSNFAYQFKKQHHLISGAKVSLPGKIISNEGAM